MSLLGNRVVRSEDPRFLTGRGMYVADLTTDAAAVVFVRSPWAHAEIVAIDTSAAEASPGVHAVVTAPDLTIGDMPPPMPNFPEVPARALLATAKVRFAGEPVVAVVADTEAHAQDAAELVEVDYDPLPVVVDVEQAVADDAVSLFEELGTNVVFSLGPRPAEIDFGACEVVVEHRLVNQRVAAAPIEPRVGAARWEGDRLVQVASTQGTHPFKQQLCAVYRLDPDRVRVITPDVGGGFGAKGFPYPEEMVLGELSRIAGCPVRWVETRSENMIAMGHGRGQVQRITIGGTRDGDISHYRVELLVEAGAYPAIGMMMFGGVAMMLTGTYDIPNAEIRSRSIVTNTTPTGAYRGAGRPEAAAAVERAVDLFAAEIGADPAEVRRRNLLPRFDQPVRVASGTTYDCGDYPAAFELMLDALDYDTLRADQAARRARDHSRLLGIGMSTYVEITAMAGRDGASEYGSVELLADGSVLARTGTTPYGQGHVTTWAMIVADRTGVPLDRITVVHGDTDAVPAGGMTGGSRSVQIAGSAMRDAAEKLVESARATAAALLEANPDDIVHDPDRGVFHVAGTPAVSVDWQAIGSATTQDGAELTAVSDFVQAHASFPFGAHGAVVEVDPETGLVRLVRHVAVDDAGTLINPLLAEGQVHGGIAQGAAQALYEEIRYDADGNLLTSNFADYAVISATEVPLFERIEMETPTPLNPLGAKGIGEAGTIGSTPAVHNAVVDAVAHLGVRHLDMPCTPEKLWRAINHR